MLALLLYVSLIVYETFGDKDQRLHLHLKCEDVYSHRNWYLVDFGGKCGLSPADESPNNPEEDYGTTVEARSSWGEYGDDEDDDVAPRIMRGENATEHEFPWMVQILWFTGSARICGGTLLNERYVLTAAHCVTDKDKTTADGSRIALRPRQIAVRMGAHYLENNCNGEGGCPPGVRQVRAEEIILHEDTYTPDNTSVRHDIALIRLRHDAIFKKGEIYPVCLPRCKMLNKDFYGETLTAIGFGQNNSVPKPEWPKTLQKIYPTVEETGEPDKRLICTKGEVNQGSCFGDSGSPLMYFGRNLAYYLIGVLSSGTQSCDKKKDPFVMFTCYTRVAPHMGWILDNMRP